jgi:hypothetical protein
MKQEQSEQYKRLNCKTFWEEEDENDESETSSKKNIFGTCIEA